MTDLAALLLAAGKGTRLRPLTRLRPKPLCPVGNVPLLDHVLRRASGVVDIEPGTVAVNAHHLAEQIVAWAGERMHVSVEQPIALGTAGAVGAVRAWVAGRDLLVLNGDAFFDGDIDLPTFVDEWDRLRPRLLVVDDVRRPDFDGRWRFAGVSLLPGAVVEHLRPEPSGLYETLWRGADVDLVATQVGYRDCGTPADYLEANLATSGGRSVVHPTATVSGVVEASVVWPDAVVHPGERLIRCIRARSTDGSDITVSAPG